jgi:2-octaprenyl-6-methoxyphenol hydroxylase
MSNATPTDFDLIIIGGGMVGASLSLALKNIPLRIALVEAVPYNTDAQPSYDDRAIALSFGTSRIFRAMGLWDEMALDATPIQRIHVSDQGHMGITRLDSRDEGVEALGYVATARELGKTLVAHLQQLENLTLLCPATLTDLKLGEDHATAILEREGKQEAITAPLVVAADGGHSAVRQHLGIQVTDKDYGQTAIIANITPERPHDNVAYERFTQHGPLALLPLGPERCSLVWTRSPEGAERILSLSDADFLAELQENFGHRLGRLLQVGKRAAYPLRLIRAQEQVRARLALIGNAAHTIHPIAGQGFNLGIRDVAALAQVLSEACKQGRDLGELSVLQDYAEWRKRDHDQVIGFTNGLVNTFSNRLPPLSLARNLGLVATDILPGIKHGLARRAMGLGGKLPRLARGLPL